MKSTVSKGWARFCGWVLKYVFRWHSDNGPVPERICIILGVPHTSIWDFVVSYFFYCHFGKVAHCMIKKEFFKGPMGWLLRRMGAVPVDRTNPVGSIEAILKDMKEDEEFHLAIALEGTRKPVKHWKTGYHYIAKAINCPVYTGYFNWGTRHIGIGEKFPLTDDAKADTARIQQYYEDKHMTARHPKNYITH